MTTKIIPILLAIVFAWTACKNDTPQQTASPAEESAAVPTTEGNAPITISPETAPGAISQSPGAQAPQPQPTPSNASSGTAPKINPPHGQPGHVCGVPVGSPLDGSAATNTAQPVQQQPESAKKTVTLPSPSSGSDGGATVAPGTNPPHGQPGHVCGVPVGSPLPKQ